MPASLKFLVIVVLLLIVVFTSSILVIINRAYAGSCTVTIIENGVNSLIPCGFKGSNLSESNHTFIGRVENIEDINNKLYLSVNLDGFHERFYLGEKNIGKLYMYKIPFSGVQELGEQIPEILSMNSADTLKDNLKGKYINFNVSSSKDKPNTMIILEQLKSLSSDKNASSIYLRETEYWKSCTDQLDTVVDSLLHRSLGNNMQRIFRYFFENGSKCTPFVSSIHIYE